jgi:hypothetical protein
MKRIFASLAVALMLVATPAIAQAGPPVKMSKNAVCHPKGGTYYNQTKNFTSFNSMAACIKAGGRPPKR